LLRWVEDELPLDRLAPAHQRLGKDLAKAGDPKNIPRFDVSCRVNAERLESHRSARADSLNLRFIDAVLVKKTIELGLPAPSLQLV
jgi:hypothetical protein